MGGGLYQGNRDGVLCQFSAAPDGTVRFVGLTFKI